MLSLQNAKSSRNRILVMRCVVIILLCGALPMISAISTTRVQAQGQAPTGKFRRVKNPIANQYIVVLDDNRALGDVTLVVRDLARVHGGRVGFIYRYSIKGFSVEMPEAAAIALSLDPRVEFVEQNGEAHLGTTQTNPPSWGLDRIDQTGGFLFPPFQLDNAYSYTKDGTGVNVYIIDSGIRTSHQDFVVPVPPNPIRAHFAVDCTALDSNGNCIGTETGEGGCDHGTLVASIAGGNLYGVAKNVSLYGVRVTYLTSPGAINCGTFDVATSIAGVDWVTNNHDPTKPAVANMSLQSNSISAAWDKAIRRSIAAGVTYVIIAGNSNRDASLSSPSDVTQAIVVGATGSETVPYPSDNRWVGALGASNFGSVLDLFAPGAGITGASSSSDTAFRTDSGTSLAGPHVTGAAAQYLQIDNTACPCVVNHILTDDSNHGGVVNAGVVGDTAGSPNKLLFVPQTWPTPPHFSLSLDGSTGYIDVPDPTSGGVPLEITGAITVEAWIKTSYTLGRQTIVERYNNSACTGTLDGGYALLIRANGTVRFEILKNGCELDLLDATGVDVRDGFWHHVAGVFDGTEMRIYIGGQFITSKSSIFTYGTGTSHLLIGRGQDGGGFFNGLIDEVRVTAAAVYTGMSSFTPQNRITGVVGTRGLWRFDVSSNHANDLGLDCAQVNNGTVVGGANYSTDVP